MLPPLAYLAGSFAGHALLELASFAAESPDDHLSFQPYSDRLLAVDAFDSVSVVAEPAAVGLNSSAWVGHSSSELVVIVPVVLAMGSLGSFEASGSSVCSEV